MVHKQQIYFSQFGRLDIQGQSGREGRVRALLKAADFVLYPYMVEGVRELCWLSFIWVLISLVMSLPSLPKAFPKAPPPNIIIILLSESLRPYEL